MRLDVLSALLTVTSMVAVGQKKWQGWVLAAANSAVVCVLAVSVEPKQWALIPPNIICIGIYANNTWRWRHESGRERRKQSRVGA